MGRKVEEKEAVAFKSFAAQHEPASLPAAPYRFCRCKICSAPVNFVLPNRAGPLHLVSGLFVDAGYTIPL